MQWNLFRKPQQFPLYAAAVLLLCGWLIPMPSLLRLLLCLLSALCAALELLPAIWKELTKEKRPNRQLLLLLAALLFFLADRPVGGAAVLLVYRFSSLLLQLRRSQVKEIISARREQLPLASYTATYSAAAPVGHLPRFLRAWMPYLFLLLAVLIAILTVIVSDLGIGVALRRAALLLVLGCEASLFSAFTLGDYAAAVAAAEQGVIFRSGALDKLLETKLLCVTEGSWKQLDTALVYSAIPNEFPPQVILQLAAHIFAFSTDPLSHTLCTLYGKPVDRSLVPEHQELNGFGIVGKVQNEVILCGSAELMNKAGLPILPFRDEKTAVHVGIHGRYAGCIYLDQQELPEQMLAALVTEAKLYQFPNSEEAQARRYPGERLFYASSDGARNPAETDDLYAALGGFGNSIDIGTQRFGRQGLADLLRTFLFARKTRIYCFSAVCVVKLLLLLLGLLTLFPLWIAILAEAAAVWVSYEIVLRRLNSYRCSPTPFWRQNT